MAQYTPSLSMLCIANNKYCNFYTALLKDLHGVYFLNFQDIRLKTQHRDQNMSSR